MIPKKIHYCWFGGADYPELMIKCMESWHKYLPEYEFILWNENNFDITCNKYVHQAYTAKKWAFISDYARLLALYNHGGIYLDTDMEILKPLDTFLHHGAFSGLDSKDDIGAALIGAQKGNKWVGKLLEEYNNRSFIRKNGNFDYTTNVTVITEFSEKHGFSPGNYHQVLDWDVHIYPIDYFYPRSPRTGKLNITNNTYALHHYAGSWANEQAKKPTIVKILGTKQFAYSLDRFFRNNRFYPQMKNAEREIRKYIKYKLRKLKNNLWFERK